jgi:hypothetical protein
MSSDQIVNTSASNIEMKPNDEDHTNRCCIDRNHDQLNNPTKRQRLIGTDSINTTVDVTSNDDGSVKNDKLTDPKIVIIVEDKIPAPLYGSKVYWEQRYSNHPQIDNDTQHQEENTNINENDDKTQQSNNEELPYHSWYFTYDEIKPIILPLILGRSDEDIEESDSDEEFDEEEDSDIVSKEVEEKIDEIIENEKISDLVPKKQDTYRSCASAIENGSSKEGEEVENDINNEEDNRLQKSDDGLASNGPVRILEIGCGDVPLVIGLTKDLHELQQETGASIENIASRVLCTDYSEIVIDTMKSQYINNSSRDENEIVSATTDVTPLKNISNCNVVEFEVADARNMNKYPNGTFQLILEKGLLDAMLSDEQVGVENCIQAVAECARLLTPRTKTKCLLVNTSSVEATASGATIIQSHTDESDLSDATTRNGCLILCSHLNAHTPKGMDWLQEVVIAGLLRGTSEYDDPDRIDWKIEVHGNSRNKSKSIHNDREDENDSNDETDEQENVDEAGTSNNDEQEDENEEENHLAGPAVYVIHKFLKTVSKDESKLANEVNYSYIELTAPLDSSDLNDIQTAGEADSCSNNRFTAVPIEFFSYDT